MSRVVSARVDQSTLDALDQEAHRRGITRTEVVVERLTGVDRTSPRGSSKREATSTSGTTRAVKPRCLEGAGFVKVCAHPKDAQNILPYGVFCRNCGTKVR